MTNNTTFLTDLFAKTVLFVTFNDDRNEGSITYPFKVFNTLAEANEYVKKHKAPSTSGKWAKVKNKNSDGYSICGVTPAKFKIMHNGVMVDKGTAAEDWVRQNPDCTQWLVRTH